MAFGHNSKKLLKGTKRYGTVRQGKHQTKSRFKFDRLSRLISKHKIAVMIQQYLKFNYLSKLEKICAS